MTKRQITTEIKADNLEYGVFYIFTDLYTPNELVSNYTKAMGKSINQFEVISRFNTKIIYTNTSPTIVARRFNAGNIGKAAILSCPVCGDISIDDRLVSEFIKRLFDFNQLDSGDNHIKISDFLSRKQQEQMQIAIEYPDLVKKLNNARTRAEEDQEPQQPKDLKDAEEQELAKAEKQREMYLELIGKLVVNYVSLTHKDPHDLLGDILTTSSSLFYSSPLIFTSKELSPLVIDSDLKLHLTLYNNAEVCLHPLSKALYILFLKHPEGIELRNISDYREELQMIYEIIIPCREDDVVETAMDNLLNPLSGTLLQNLSHIKRFFKTIIMDDDIAKKYYINGKRGKIYKLSLPRRLVTIPRIF